MKHQAPHDTAARARQLKRGAQGMAIFSVVMAVAAYASGMMWMYSCSSFSRSLGQNLVPFFLSFTWVFGLCALQSHLASPKLLPKSFNLNAPVFWAMASVVLSILAGMHSFEEIWFRGLMMLGAFVTGMVAIITTVRQARRLDTEPLARADSPATDDSV